MSFIQLFEDPDHVFTKGGEDMAYYWSSDNLSYTVAFLPKHHWHALVRQDGMEGGSGHGSLRELLKKAARAMKMQEILPSGGPLSDPNPLLKSIKSDGDVLQIIKDHNEMFKGFTYEGEWLFVKARLWDTFKVVSFWDPWTSNLVQPTLEALKLVGMNPAECIYEMDGFSCKDVTDPEKRADEHSLLLTFEEFKTGIKKAPATPEEKEAQSRRAADMEIYRKVMNGGYGEVKKKMDLFKSAGLDPYTGRAKAGPSWTRRDGD